MLRLRWFNRDFVLLYFVERSRSDMIKGSMVVEDFNLSENLRRLQRSKGWMNNFLANALNVSAHLEDQRSYSTLICSRQEGALSQHVRAHTWTLQPCSSTSYTCVPGAVKEINSRLLQLHPVYSFLHWFSLEEFPFDPLFVLISVRKFLQIILPILYWCLKVSPCPFVSSASWRDLPICLLGVPGQVFVLDRCTEKITLHAIFPSYQPFSA